MTMLQAFRRCSVGAAPLPRAWTLGHKQLNSLSPRQLHGISYDARHLTQSNRAAAVNHSVLDEATTTPHIPVLLDEILTFFEGRNVRVYVDGTLGAGGHASAVLRAHPGMAALVGFDLDPTAHALASRSLTSFGARVIPVSLNQPGGTVSLGDALVLPPASATQSENTNHNNPTTTTAAYLVRANFSAWASTLPQLPGALDGTVDAALLDLGVSSMQVDTAERGFSFMRDGPLDMRMDPDAAVSAEDVINMWSEAKLGAAFRDFGEERHWRGIARRIAAAREEAPIRTTQQLVAAVGGGHGGGGGRGRGRGDRGNKHPATRVFQALRIAVNGELQSVAEVLPAAIKSLAPGGRLAVITFHSLEDRIVKWAFRSAAGMTPSDEPLPSYCVPFDESREADVRILTKRPVAPSAEEQKANPRSRSAKLRVVEKL